MTEEQRPDIEDFLKESKTVDDLIKRLVPAIEEALVSNVPCTSLDIAEAIVKASVRCIARAAAVKKIDDPDFIGSFLMTLLYYSYYFARSMSGAKRENLKDLNDSFNNHWDSEEKKQQKEE